MNNKKLSKKITIPKAKSKYPLPLNWNLFLAFGNTLFFTNCIITFGEGYIRLSSFEIKNLIYKIKYGFYLLVIFFFSSCSDPFPKGALFEFMILQKLISGGGIKYIFLTTNAYNGNLGGVAGADSKCQTEKNTNFTNLPGFSNEYLAFIVDGAESRRACSTANCGGGVSENANWVLKPNTDYYRLDSGSDTKIFSTNASGIVNFAGGESLLTPIDPSGTTKWWTGLDTDWTFSVFACLGGNWGSNSGFGTIGVGASTGNTSIRAGGSTSCSVLVTDVKLLCVRQ